MTGKDFGTAHYIQYKITVTIIAHFDHSLFLVVVHLQWNDYVQGVVFVNGQPNLNPYLYCVATMYCGTVGLVSAYSRCS